jgi:hypothetical protein
MKFGRSISCGCVSSLVMAIVENYWLPPCVLGGFVSNIKVFSTVMLLGRPFAPNDSRRRYSLSIVSQKSIQPKWVR